jgi:hypothetical protein
LVAQTIEVWIHYACAQIDRHTDIVFFDARLRFENDAVCSPGWPVAENASHELYSDVAGVSVFRDECVHVVVNENAIGELKIAENRNQTFIFLTRGHRVVVELEAITDLILFA